MTEAEFNQAQDQGNVNVQDSQQSAPVSEPTPTPDAKEYEGLLGSLQRPRIYLTTPPTFVPKTFADSIQYYDDGTFKRIYFYLNNAWSYVPISTPMTLLKSNSGTDTNASAANVDTIDISGLTAKDTLVFYLDFSTVTQPTATIELYSPTDSVRLLLLSTPTIADTNFQGYSGSLKQEQQANTKIFATAHGVDAVVANNDLGAGKVRVRSTTVTTPWTDPWTLALRHNGVTAGGTFRWSWSVFKLAGQ